MKSILNAIQNTKVIVIGDILLDHYIWGDAIRISPEAPVPVVAVDRDSFTAGGAANVALNITALGGQVELCGLIGKDPSSEALLDIFSQNNVQFDSIFQTEHTDTIVKTRVVVRNQQICRVDREKTAPFYNIKDTQHIQALENKIKQADVIIFSDYAKGTITQTTYDHLCAFAKKHNCLVAVDPKPINRVTYKNADLFTPNKYEALQMSKIELLPHEELPTNDICSAIWNTYSPENLVVTLGADGMLLGKAGNPTKTIPTFAKEVFDVSGAGDTVIASLALAMAAHFTIEEAAHFANTAAGVVVSKLGTATATPEEILTYQAEHALELVSS